MAITPEQQARLNQHLFNAMENGDIKAAKIAIQNGADVNADFKEGYPALYIATTI